MSCVKPESSGVLHGSHGLILFSIFVNELDDGVESTLRKWANNTELGRVADTPGLFCYSEGLQRLEKWASSFVENNTQDPVSTTQNVRQQCTLEAKRANGIVDCTRTAVATRVRQVILPLYSTLLRPSLKCCIHF